MTDPLAWTAGQILGVKVIRVEHTLAKRANEETVDVLQFVKSVNRPVTWADVSDRFKRSRRWSQRKLASLRDQLHVNRADNRLGLPARYEWRGK